MSVKREKFKPLAGPDGGNGGHGGDIVLVADPQVTTLLSYHHSPHRTAGNGGFGMGDHRAGAAGETLELPVPVGTVVKDADGETLVDMIEPGDALRRRPRRHRRPRQRGAREPEAQGARLRAAGHARLGGRCPPRAQDRRRRRPRRLPVGRQVEPDRRDLRGAPEDRRLPVHHAAPEPRRRAGGRRALHGRRRARAHRGRERGQGPRPRVPAPRRALHGAACTCSTARPSSPAATRSATST